MPRRTSPAVLLAVVLFQASTAAAAAAMPRAPRLPLPLPASASASAFSRGLAFASSHSRCRSRAQGRAARAYFGAAGASREASRWVRAGDLRRQLHVVGPGAGPGPGPGPGPNRLFSAVERIRGDGAAEEQHPQQPDLLKAHSDFSAAAGAAAPPGLEDHAQVEVKSRPVPGGNWDPSDPLAWAEGFGSRSEAVQAELDPLVRLGPGDEERGYFDSSDLELPSITMVRTVEDAERVMEVLMSADPTILHACDTEVMAIELKSVGPVGNGYVTCASCYAGPNFDYGLGDGPGTVLWIDNLDDAAGVLQVFKPWFEDERFKKVWHNYGFDRHVMFNEGIDVRGFGGDTMHMARLENTARAKIGGQGSGYSLEGLTSDLLNRRKKPMKEIFGVPRLRKDGTPGSIVDIPPVELLQRDPRFRQAWIMYSAYDAEGTWQIREELQNRLEKKPWIRGRNLFDYYWTFLRDFGEVLTDMERRGIQVDTQYLADVEVQARADRERHMQAFRRWAATLIGPDGLAINPASSVQLTTFLFGGAENIKTKERTEQVRTFKVSREEISEEAIEAFHAWDQTVGDASSSADNDTDEFDHMKAAQLKSLCKEYGLKVSGKKAELQERLRGHFLAAGMKEQQIDSRGNGDDVIPSSEEDFDSMEIAELRDACVARGLGDKGSEKALRDRLKDDTAYSLELHSALSPNDVDGYQTIAQALAAAEDRDGNLVLRETLAEVRERTSAEPKYVDVTITSIGMEPEKHTASGAPSVTAAVLRKLAGDPLGDDPKYGTAYDFFGGGEKGHEACVGLYSLTAIGSIDTMIANFITSLQTLADEKKRVHCSLNLNTETGRLSSRRPNLQNQPALEKDTYKIREAFQASPGNNLIVADYGQLELRLLASMTDCTSMIEAFHAGGDFHSRTALGMFDYIQERVDSGECLLEWDYANGDPPKPMLKDEFASERRKAKTLNFSIAYGKTAHGLSQDWGVSIEEAEKMLKAWYDSRPEVRTWQEETKKTAMTEGVSRSLMGRYRDLPEAMGNNRKLIGHALRASINTPIQGGAADVAMSAMIKINKSPLLRKLGWILLMQIHDEVILEGPEETAEEAFAEVVKCMEEPWTFGLDKTAVPLLVDGSYTHKNWYDAK